MQSIAAPGRLRCDRSCVSGARSMTALMPSNGKPSTASSIVSALLALQLSCSASACSSHLLLESLARVNRLHTICGHADGM